MSMSRKDYTKTAAILAGELAIGKGNPAVVLTVQNIMRSMADMFAQDNSAFDRGRFYVACGFTADGFTVAGE